MAMQEPLRLGIQSHDVMHALLSPLHSANTIVQSKAALAVAATACDVEARTEVSVCITFLLSSGRLLPLHSFETFSSALPHPSFKSLEMQDVGKQTDLIQPRK